MANFLVTGGSGFVGSNVVNRLLGLGHWVYYTGRQAGENKVGANYLGVDFHKVDFSTLPAIETVFHEAAITDTLEHDRRKMFRVNVEQPLVLFEKARAAGCKGVVYASSCAVYGSVEPPFVERGPFCPLNVYAESKLTLDYLAACLASKEFYVTGLRYSNVYGPGEGHKGHSSSMIYQLIQKVKAGERPRLFEWGQQARDFVHVDDVVDLNVAAAQAGVGGTFNGGCGEAWSFNDIFKIVQKELESDLEIEYVPNTISDYYQDLTMCDMSKSQARLGFVPKFMPALGIRRYVRSLDDGGA